MFWKCIRWGGTVAVIVLVLVAGYSAMPSAPTPTTEVPAQPAEGAQQPAKNFNL